MGARRRGRLHVDGRRADWLRDGALDGRPLLILAHGAGAGCESAPLEDAAQQLVARGLAVARFQFPYMQAARDSGRRRPPDRAAVLLATWSAMLAAARRWRGVERLVLGGRSMGGRMASLLAAEGGNQDIHALVCLSYPFHPAGKPCHLRTRHLADLSLPSMIVQGERDRLGNRAEVEGYYLSSAIKMHWCQDGDHDLTPRKRSGYSQGGNWDVAMDAVASFLAPL